LFENINNMANFDWMVFVVIPLLIFSARIIDVSIGTLRIILVSKGLRIYATLLGFVESLVWVTAIVQVMQNLNGPVNYVAYALGFSMGTYIGMFLETKISIGKVVLRLITNRDNSALLERLIIENYNLTTIDAEGRMDRVKIIFMVLDRKQVPRVVSLINKFHPNSFYTVEDLRYVSDLDYVKRPHPRLSKMKMTNLRRIFTMRK